MSNLSERIKRLASFWKSIRKNYTLCEKKETKNILNKIILALYYAISFNFRDIDIVHLHTLKTLFKLF